MKLFKFFDKSMRDDRDVVMESSICTGEKTIGFKNPETGKIEKSVVVHTKKDVDAFYKEHNLIKTKDFKI